MTAPIPVERMSRTNDPRTSLEAARLAAKASALAVEAVEGLMKDGVGRIDEEIWTACRARGFLKSLPTIQHGRLALSEAGLIKATGKIRPTSNGAGSREWVWAEAPAAS